MSRARYSVVDFLSPIGLETYSVHIPAVNVEAVRWSTYGAPLKVKAWWLLVMFSLIFAFLIYTAQKSMAKKNYIKTGKFHKEPKVRKVNVKSTHLGNLKSFCVAATVWRSRHVSPDFMDYFHCEL